jgi:hypothetical protein
MSDKPESDELKTAIVGADSSAQKIWSDKSDPTNSDVGRQTSDVGLSCKNSQGDGSLASPSAILNGSEESWSKILHCAQDDNNFRITSQEG